MLHRAKVVQRSRTLAAYHKIIHEQLQRRFIEKVTDPQSTTSRVHYISHHAVLKESSTTPLRIVYDCSCSPNAAQPSLNSCLSTGPDILNDITSILVRFRCYRYGITADIEKVFLSISLDEQNRDATRSSGSLTQRIRKVSLMSTDSNPSCLARLVLRLS
jgi:hypothetical protein